MSTADASDDSIVLYVGTEPFCLAMCDAASKWRSSIIQRRPESREEINCLLNIIEGEVTVTYTTIVGDFIVTTTSTMK